MDKLITRFNSHLIESRVGNVRNSDMDLYNYNQIMNNIRQQHIAIIIQPKFDAPFWTTHANLFNEESTIPHQTKSNRSHPSNAICAGDMASLNTEQNADCQVGTYSLAQQGDVSTNREFDNEKTDPGWYSDFSTDTETMNDNDSKQRNSYALLSTKTNAAQFQPESLWSRNFDEDEMEKYKDILYPNSTVAMAAMETPFVLESDVESDISYTSIIKNDGSKPWKPEVFSNSFVNENSDAEIMNKGYECEDKLLKGTVNIHRSCRCPIIDGLAFHTTNNACPSHCVSAGASDLISLNNQSPLQNSWCGVKDLFEHPDRWSLGYSESPIESVESATIATQSTVYECESENHHSRVSTLLRVDFPDNNNSVLYPTPAHCETTYNVIDGGNAEGCLFPSNANLTFTINNIYRCKLPSPQQYNEREVEANKEAETVSRSTKPRNNWKRRICRFFQRISCCSSANIAK